MKALQASKRPFCNRRFSWHRAVFLLAMLLVVYSSFFLYNLWQLYQPYGLCHVSARFVDLYIKLHLYHLTYRCL